MRELGFKRVLFLVHRGQLARQTKKSYEKIFARTVSMGLVGAGYHEYGADYVFATVQTLIEMNTCFNMIRIHLIVLFWMKLTMFQLIHTRK